MKQWDKMTGTFNYEGVLITKNGENDYTVFGKPAKSFGECVERIKSARKALSQSMLRRGAVIKMEDKRKAI